MGSDPLSPSVLAEGLAFPEGPAFDRDGALWWVELKGGCLGRLDATGLTRFDVGGAPNGIAIDRNDRPVFCDAGQNAVRRLDPATGATITLVASTSDRPLAGPNDLAYDGLGNLVFTCPGSSRDAPIGEIWCLTAAGAMIRVAEGLFFPNGLAFVEDGRRLVVAETYRQRLWIGDWEASTAEWTDAAPFLDLPGPPTGPDGMAAGADGLIHVAVFGQGKIVSATLSGEIVGETPTPGVRPTNCAFDPRGHLGLVVSEAERGELLSYPSFGRGLALSVG